MWVLTFLTGYRVWVLTVLTGLLGVGPYIVNRVIGSLTHKCRSTELAICRGNATGADIRRKYGFLRSCTFLH